MYGERSDSGASNLRLVRKELEAEMRLPQAGRRQVVVRGSVVRTTCVARSIQNDGSFSHTREKVLFFGVGRLGTVGIEKCANANPMQREGHGKRRDARATSPKVSGRDKK